MPGFINSFNNVTMSNITSLSNNTNLADFYIKVNTQVYDGWLSFMILITLGIILFLALNKINDNPSKNLMYVTTLLTLISLLLRGVYAIIGGLYYAFITDYQLWVFPIITAVIILVIWATKE